MPQKWVTCRGTTVTAAAYLELQAGQPLKQPLGSVSPLGPPALFLLLQRCLDRLHGLVHIATCLIRCRRACYDPRLLSNVGRLQLPQALAGLSMHIKVKCSSAVLGAESGTIWQMGAMIRPSNVLALVETIARGHA